MKKKINNIQKRECRYTCIKNIALICLVFVFSACSVAGYWHNRAIHYYPHTGRDRLPPSELVYLMMKGDDVAVVSRGGNKIELRQIDDYDVPPGLINGTNRTTIAFLPGERTLVFIIKNYTPKGKDVHQNSLGRVVTTYKYTTVSAKVTKKIKVTKGEHYLVMLTSSGKDVIIQKRIVE